MHGNCFGEATFLCCVGLYVWFCKMFAFQRYFFSVCQEKRLSCIDLAQIARADADSVAACKLGSACWPHSWPERHTPWFVVAEWGLNGTNGRTNGPAYRVLGVMLQWLLARPLMGHTRTFGSCTTVVLL